jgi:uncharacterized protein
MNYLADTNIFLEVLLNQSKAETCKDFLQSSTGNIFISDFSLHSIGVILFRKNKVDLFKQFTRDIQNGLSVKTLSIDNYSIIADYNNLYTLDFDDAYQLGVASEFELTIKTLDRDFERVSNTFPIEFQ